MQYKHKAWDPIDSAIDSKQLSKEAKDIQRRLQYTINHQADFERLTRLIITLTVTALALALFIVPRLTIPIEDTVNIYLIIMGTGLAFFVALISARRELATDAAKLLLAHREHWLYDPKQDNVRWQQLATHFPEIFKRGGNPQNITDQYWGTWKGTSFWSGIFTYHVQHGKSSVVYRRTVYGFKLSRKVAADLTVLPKGMEKRVHQKIQLESNEFNRLFHIQYNHKEINKLQHIYEVLHPALMATLMDLRTTVGEYLLTFRQDVAIISVPGAVELEHTNLQKFTGIDARDVAQFEANLQLLLESTKKIVQNLD